MSEYRHDIDLVTSKCYNSDCAQIILEINLQMCMKYLRSPLGLKITLQGDKACAEWTVKMCWCQI